MKMKIKYFLLTILICACHKDAFAQQLHLQESSNWINIGDLDLPGNSITIEALIYPEAIPSINYKWNIISKHENLSNVNYFLRPDNFGITTYDIGTSGSTSFFNLTIDYPFELNKLYHIAGTYDGTVMKFYINGCLTDSLFASGNLFQNDLPTGLGQRWIIEDEQFVGYLDEVRIWNTARSEQEIRESMNSLQDPFPSALIAYYNFESDFTNIANPGIYDGIPIGNPLIASNALFEEGSIELPEIIIDYNCFNNSVSIGLIGSNQFTYLVDNEVSSQNIWDNVSGGNHIISVELNDWCINPLDYDIFIETVSNLNINDTIRLCPGDSVLINDQWINSSTQINFSVEGTHCDTIYNIQIIENLTDNYDSLYVFCYPDQFTINDPKDLWYWVIPPPEPGQDLINESEFNLKWVDVFGCNHQENIIIEFMDSEQIKHFVPNIFNPYSSNKNNNSFSILFNNVELLDDFELFIFDRWGNLLFKSIQPQSAWDGTFRGKIVESGVYVYLFKYNNTVCFENLTIQESGTITLIK